MASTAQPSSGVTEGQLLLLPPSTHPGSLALHLSSRGKPLFGGTYFWNEVPGSPPLNFPMESMIKTGLLLACVSWLGHLNVTRIPIIPQLRFAEKQFQVGLLLL